MLQHTDLCPLQPSLQHTPCLSGAEHLCNPPDVLLLLQISAREGVHQAPWEMAVAGFLSIFKMLTTTLCPWMFWFFFLLWAFLSVLVKLNHFVTRREPGPALSLQTQQQLILLLQLLAPSLTLLSPLCVTGAGAAGGGTACSRQGWSPANQVLPSPVGQISHDEIWGSS